MGHRFLSLDQTSSWLDRLLHEDPMPVNSAERGTLHGNFINWNSMLPPYPSEVFPNPYVRTSLPGDETVDRSSPDFHHLNTRPHVLPGSTEFLPLPSFDDRSEIMSSTIRRGEQEFESLWNHGETSGQASLELCFLEAVQFLCTGFAGSSVTVPQAIAILGLNTMKLLWLGTEVFSLADGSITNHVWADRLWQHSLRVGYLARIIAESETDEVETIRASCAAGMLHDLGLLVFNNSFQEVYGTINAKAQRQACSLDKIEQSTFGLSHGEIGALLLDRWGVGDAIVEAVAWHDEPYRTSTPGFTPLTAVYVANILDGGGWPQDGDGVPTDKALEYLSVCGLGDQWPKWQEWLTTSISSPSSSS